MKRFACLSLIAFLCAGSSQAQTGWFREMYEANQSATTDSWKKDRAKTFFNLRGKYYHDTTAMLQMSWEERDHIWDDGRLALPALAGRYRAALNISCKERGVPVQDLDTSILSLVQLTALRSRYLDSRKAEYIILTPAEQARPAINGALVYGVRPGHELIYKIPVTGKAPIKLKVEGLPAGLRFDASAVIIRGVLKKAGEYNVKLTGVNGSGSDTKTILLKVGNDIALTPPMGWNSWNSFASDVTAKDIRNTVDVLTRSGLVNYGWSFVNIDDCWMMHPQRDSIVGGDEVLAYYDRRQKARINNRVRFDEDQVTGDTRDAKGAIKSNQDFPDMKGLTEYIHAHGLKAGLYTSPGPLTCQCYEGAYQHETQDAKQFADWGFDYLKYDWCGYTGIAPKPDNAAAKAPYALMGEALQKVNRDIVFSLCQYGRNDVWQWAPEVHGNLWRTTGDIRDTWESMSKIGFNQAGLEKYAGPGHWNDPDMLVVGYVGWSKNLRPTYLSPNEQYTHISLWSLLSAPMLIGCDLTRLDPFTKGLLSNPEVIAINQNPLGIQAKPEWIQGDLQVWVKPLDKNGKQFAVGIFNLGEEPMRVDLQEVAGHVPQLAACFARNAWTRTDLGKWSGRTKPLQVNRHGCILLTAEK